MYNLLEKLTPIESISRVKIDLINSVPTHAQTVITSKCSLAAIIYIHLAIA